MTLTIVLRYQKKNDGADVLLRQPHSTLPMEQSTGDTYLDGAFERLYTVEPLALHTHSIILLHGLGSNGVKFGEEFLRTARRSDSRSVKELLPGARFIFPTAKRRRSSAFPGAKLTQWFDIARLGDPSYRRHTQVPGLEESMRGILHLVDQERSKVSAGNVLLGGLSQGGAMSMMCLLAMGFPIGGYMGMSTWMPYSQDIRDLLSDAHDDGDENNPFESDGGNGDDTSEKKPIENVMGFISDLLDLNDAGSRVVTNTSITTPVFLGHGSRDEKVVLSRGEGARDVLQDIGFAIHWNVYEDLGHWYKIPDEIDDLTGFIQNTMGWALHDGKN